MNKLQELVIEGGIYDCLLDPYDSLGNGCETSSIMGDVERYGEKIVRECISIIEECDIIHIEKQRLVQQIIEHFQIGE